MENNKNAVFRSAMSGYNKKDVNEYIAALSRRYEEQISVCESQLAAVIQHAGDLEAKVSALEAELAKAGEETELHTKLSAAQKSLEEAQKLLSARTEQAASLSEECEALKEQLSDTKTKLSLFAGMQEKLADYERMKAKMGELYLEAASSAGRIKTEAEEYAAQKRANSDAELALLRTAQFDRIASMVSGMQEELLKVIDSYREKAAALEVPADPASQPIADEPVPAEVDIVAKELENFKVEEVK